MPQTHRTARTVPLHGNAMLALELRDRLGPGADRVVDVGAGVGEADVFLRLALHDAAGAQKLVEARGDRLVALQRVAIVLDRLVGEDDVEQRRLAPPPPRGAGPLRERA